jgi:serine/threonine-protein kinase
VIAPAARVNRSALLGAAVATALVTAPAAWFLKPAPAAEPRPIVRFDFEVPAGTTFRNTGRPVVALSPDGRHFAYNTAAGVYLRSMDTLASRLIPGTEGALVNVFFSPDGEWLAYWAVETQSLQKISIGGGAPVTIAPTAAPFGASWGRDGNILIGQLGTILRVSADGGAPTTVLTFKEGEVPFAPSLLPDGRTILYSLTRTNGPNRWNVSEIVAQEPGGAPKVLVRGGADAVYVPTGHLVYSAGNVLYAMAFDASTLETSGGPVPLVTGLQRAAGPAVNTGAANYGLSDRGTLVYLGQLATADTPQGGLGLADRTGTVKMLEVPKANYRSPRVSPEGRRLAVETITETNQNVIWVYELSGASAMRRLTQEGNNTRPIWTPDGQRIAYGQLAEKGAGIFWQPADGSGLPERLTTAPDGQFDMPESFSPDGKVLSFARVRPPMTANSWGLWTIAVDSSERTPQMFFDLPNSNEFGAAFSPDGKWLAYASNADPNPNNPSTNFAIYVQPYPPTGVKYQISQTAGTWPIWTAGGRELIYRPNADGGVQRLNLVTISLSPAPAFTSEKTLPIEGFLPIINYREYDVLPDGKALVMVFPAERGQNAAPPAPRIHTVMNWTEELKARVPTKAR